MRIYFCIITLLSLLSCKKDVEQLPPIEKTITLLGRWKEVGPKAALFDSNGNFIDSIDLNATYEFKDNFTYLSENDISTDALEGTWTFDSTYQSVMLNPVAVGVNGQSEHIWYIYDLTTDSLSIGHQYKLTLPDQFYHVLRFRKFYKLY